MAADPTLADRVLADQLERHAAQRFVGEPVSGMCRAAAVRLRKLDAIEEAIGDMDPDMVDSLRKAQAVVRHRLSPSVAEPTLAAAVLIERIADALGGTEP